MVLYDRPSAVLTSLYRKCSLARGVRNGYRSPDPIQPERSHLVGVARRLVSGKVWVCASAQLATENTFTGGMVGGEAALDETFINEPSRY